MAEKQKITEEEKARKSQRKLLKLMGKMTRPLSSQMLGDKTPATHPAAKALREEMIEMIFYDIFNRLQPIEDIPEPGERDTDKAKKRLDTKLKLTKPEHQKKHGKAEPRQLAYLTKFADIVDEFLPEYSSGKDHPVFKKKKETDAAIKKEAATKTLKELLENAKDDAKKKGKPEPF